MSAPSARVKLTSLFYLPLALVLNCETAPFFSFQNPCMTSNVLMCSMSGAEVFMPVSYPIIFFHFCENFIPSQTSCHSPILNLIFLY
jgi:hypothetical protein